MRKKRVLAVILVVVLCMSLLASCGDKAKDTNSTTNNDTQTADNSNSNSNSSNDSSNSSSNTQTNNDSNSQQQQPPPAEEVVFYGVCTFEETWWDPALYMGLNDANLASAIFENLVKLQADGSVTPWLAESWDVSADGLAYTFHLRKGVQWHKGYGEFTSEDVKFSLERHLDPAVASVNAENLQMANIKSIDCPDPYTVVLNLNQIDVDLVFRLAMYYGIIVCKAHNDRDGLESMNKDPIGTGPYVFDGGTLGLRTEVVRNRDWWGEYTGNLDRVVSTYISDTNTIFAAFDNGELDSIGLYDREKMYEYQSKGYEVSYNSVRQLLYIGVNMQLPPFDDPKVREAFFYAVDVQYYLDNLFYGQETACGTYVPPTCKYALRDYFKFEYNIEKAKQLLAEAGYPNGCPMTMWSVNDALGQPPAIIAQDMLSRAGFTIDMQNVEFGVFIGQVRDGTAQMWVLYNDTDTTGDGVIIRYMSDFYPGNNWCGVLDAEYDSYVAAGMAAKTEQEKYDNYYAAQRRLMDLQVVFPVATNSMGRVSQKNVTGFESQADMGWRPTSVIKS
ncbi:MAG: ABC transporter substrate-binding protein [Oscillospiraceae bacterium]|nr:ABC transporter substrate-binding protein [Oscillospiraceae bacterium]